MESRGGKGTQHRREFPRKWKRILDKTVAIKHVRGDRGDRRQQKKEWLGREERRNSNKSTLVHAERSLVHSRSITTLSSLETCSHPAVAPGMLHFYSPFSIPLRRWIPLFYNVRLGSIQLDQTSQSVNHRVFKIITHPQTQRTTADIALLKLVSRVTFTSSILPICLPRIKKQLKIPASCWVTGWGNVKDDEGENG